MSTSTTATWEPNGYVESVPSKSSSWRSGPGSMPVGQLRRVVRRRRRARPTLTPRDGTPDTSSWPSPTTMSSASASSRLAAICLAFASTSVDATCTALPAVCSDREPIVPEPRGHAGGVGVDQPDAVHRDAEDVAGEHRERRVMALAVDARADDDARRAVVVHLDGAVLDVQPDRRRDLDVRRHADAELHGVAALAAGRLLGAQLVVAGGGEGGVERLGVLAGVVVGAGRAWSAGRRPAGGSCGGGSRPGRCRVRRRRRPSPARSAAWPRGARRPGRRRSSSCWSTAVTASKWTFGTS